MIVLFCNGIYYEIGEDFVSCAFRRLDDRMLGNNEKELTNPETQKAYSVVQSFIYHSLSHSHCYGLQVTYRRHCVVCRHYTGLFCAILLDGVGCVTSVTLCVLVCLSVCV